MNQFILDLESIRLKARESIAKGALTDSNQAKVEEILRILDAALATEVVCALRYLHHSITASGVHAESIAKHFAVHSNDELQHAKSLAVRIDQLGGNPEFNPRRLSDRAHSEYKECSNLRQMIEENLIAERIAIMSYADAIRFIGDSDATSRRVLEKILEKEEEHANDLANLLESKDGWVSNV